MVVGHQLGGPEELVVHVHNGTTTVVELVARGYLHDQVARGVTGVFHHVAKLPIVNVPLGVVPWKTK